MNAKHMRLAYDCCLMCTLDPMNKGVCAMKNNSNCMAICIYFNFVLGVAATVRTLCFSPHRTAPHLCKCSHRYIRTARCVCIRTQSVSFSFKPENLSSLNLCAFAMRCDKDIFRCCQSSAIVFFPYFFLLVHIVCSANKIIQTSKMLVFVPYFKRSLAPFARCVARHHL